MHAVGKSALASVSKWNSGKVNYSKCRHFRRFYFSGETFEVNNKYIIRCRLLKYQLIFLLIFLILNKLPLSQVGGLGFPRFPTITRTKIKSILDSPIEVSNLDLKMHFISGPSDVQLTLVAFLSIKLRFTYSMFYNGLKQRKVNYIKYKTS